MIIIIISLPEGIVVLVRWNISESIVAIDHLKHHAERGRQMIVRRVVIDSHSTTKKLVTKYFEESKRVGPGMWRKLREPPQ